MPVVNVIKWNMFVKRGLIWLQFSWNWWCFATACWFCWIFLWRSSRLTVSSNRKECFVHLHIDSRAWCLQPWLIAVFVFLIVFSLANQLQTLSCHWGFVHWYIIVDMPKWGLYCSNLGALIPKHTLPGKVNSLITKRSVHVKT